MRNAHASATKARIIRRAAAQAQCWF